MYLNSNGKFHEYNLWPWKGPFVEVVAGDFLNSWPRWNLAADDTSVHEGPCQKIHPFLTYEHRFAHMMANTSTRIHICEVRTFDDQITLMCLGRTCWCNWMKTSIPHSLNTVRGTWVLFFFFFVIVNEPIAWSVSWSKEPAETVHRLILYISNYATHDHPPTNGVKVCLWGRILRNIFQPAKTDHQINNVQVIVNNIVNSVK